MLWINQMKNIKDKNEYMQVCLYIGKLDTIYKSLLFTIFYRFKTPTKIYPR